MKLATTLTVYGALLALEIGNLGLQALLVRGRRRRTEDEADPPE